MSISHQRIVQHISVLTTNYNCRPSAEVPRCVVAAIRIFPSALFIPNGKQLLSEKGMFIKMPFFIERKDSLFFFFWKKLKLFTLTSHRQKSKHRLDTNYSVQTD